MKKFDVIAKSCPLLEEIEIGYRCNSKIEMDDSCFESLAFLFPYLRSVNLGIARNLTGNGLLMFCAAMGTRLERLEIREARRRSNPDCGLSNDTLWRIGCLCPNLKLFRYLASCVSLPNIKEGILLLLDGCIKLERLHLVYRGPRRTIVFDSKEEEFSGLSVRESFERFIESGRA
jgi:hypothetical protein